MTLNTVLSVCCALGPPLPTHPLDSPNSLQCGPVGFVSGSQFFMVKPMLNYMVRDCAPLGVITSKLSSSISCQFRGPESCGKTTTLHQVYAKLKQREGETVAYIDMKNMGVGLGYLEQLPGVKDIIFLVDNAQVLGTHSLLESSQRVRSIISRRAKSACYTFSPVVCDFYGNSVKGGWNQGHIYHDVYSFQRNRVPAIHFYAPPTVSMFHANSWGVGSA